jgi:hypothetical protein
MFALRMINLTLAAWSHKKSASDHLKIYISRIDTSVSFWPLLGLVEAVVTSRISGLYFDLVVPHAREGMRVLTIIGFQS